MNDNRMWVQYMTPMLIVYRATLCESTGNSPFYIHKGYDMSLPGDLIFGASQKYLGEDYSKQAIRRVYQTFQLATKHLIDSQWYNLQRVNKDRENPKFQVGEPVLYRYPGTLAGGNREGLQSKKLRGAYLPYWRILEKKSPVNYIIYNEVNGKFGEFTQGIWSEQPRRTLGFERIMNMFHYQPGKRKVKWVKTASLDQELQYEKEDRLQEKVSDMVSRSHFKRSRVYLPQGAKMVENEPHFGKDFEWQQLKKTGQNFSFRTEQSAEGGNVLHDDPTNPPF